MRIFLFKVSVVTLVITSIRKKFLGYQEERKVKFRLPIKLSKERLYLFIISKYHDLDISKSIWINKLKATINMNTTVLPKVF